jgi:predicted amidohydrolase
MKTIMRLACVQTNVQFADLSRNLETVLQKLAEARQEKADLVVFPECVLSGYGFESRAEALGSAISLSDSLWSRLIEPLSASGMYVTLGFLEKTEDPTPRLFNASILVGPSGIVGHYRKVHLPHLGVDRFVDRGDIPYQTLSAGESRVGLAICYDCSFPEPIRVLGLAGADIIALGTNWPTAAIRTAAIVPPARSMENHLFFVAANRVGTERGFQYCGRSSIHGPDGIELARSHSDDETILYADVDVNQARNKRIERTPGRHVIDRFADRCPAFYTGIDKPANR